MGENLVVPHRPTINTAINYALTRPVKAFPASAVIVTEKDIPDVSFWQGEIDYIIMSSKTDALIMRSGQRDWVDRQFGNNYSRSKSKGMIRGVYDFYDDTVSPRTHVDRIVNQIGTDLPEMEIYIDWERSYGGQFSGLQNVVATMQSLEDRLGVTAGLYTGYYWFRANSNPITHASQYNYLKDKPLWLAWYTSNPADVLVPAPWSHLTLWQYGTPAEDYGQDGTIEIDKNYFNGTLRSFYDRYGVFTPTPGVNMFFKVTSLSSNIRSSAGVADNDLGADNLIQNDIVETEDIPTTISGVTWRKLKRWWRNSVERPLPPSPTGQHWAAEKSTTAVWLISTIFTPPPPASGDYILHYKPDGTVKKYVPE